MRSNHGDNFSRSTHCLALTTVPENMQSLVDAMRLRVDVSMETELPKENPHIAKARETWAKGKATLGKLLDLSVSLAEYQQLGQLPDARIKAAGSLDAIQKVMRALESAKEMVDEPLLKTGVINRGNWLKVLHEATKVHTDYAEIYVTEAKGPHAEAFSELSKLAGGAPAGAKWTETVPKAGKLSSKKFVELVDGSLAALHKPSLLKALATFDQAPAHNYKQSWK